jgi:ribosomal protein S27E
MDYTKTQWLSFPESKNCDMISCQYCENETAVLNEANVVRYTCPTCWSVPRLNKKEAGR